MRPAALAPLCSIALFAYACSTGPGEGFTPATADGGIPSTNPNGDAAVTIPDAGPVADGKPIGTLTGKAFAPNGQLPLPGAVIYLTTSLPAEGPRGAICDTCIDLTALPAHGESAVDGSFEVPIYQRGKQYLVIEKGRFRRVREVTMNEGVNAVPAAYTSIPGKNAPAVGDFAPKILVIPTTIATFDNVHQTLGALQFDFDQVTGTAAESLLRDRAKLSEYSFVFLPCGLNDQSTCSDPNAYDPAVAGALRAYVKGGGRLYVTDYAYEYVRRTWPKPIDWYETPEGDATTAYAGKGCDRTQIIRPGTWLDPGLKAWMGAVGQDPNGEDLKGIYTTIDAVKAVAGEGPDGAPVTITPKVWVAAAGKPSTVTFPDRCGRVLFSTNHTDGGAQGTRPLLAQEKAIVYTMLEVSTCIRGSVDR